MKIKIFLTIFILCFYCHSSVKSIQWDIFGIETDGKSIFSVVYNNKSEKLQRLFPTKKETSFLPPYKSHLRSYEIVNDKIILLFDNIILIYDTNLNLIKKLFLPDDQTEYHFNYSLNRVKESLIIMGGDNQCFLLKNLNLLKLQNEIVVDGNRIELKNNLVLINDNPTEVKYNKFSSLITFLFVLNDKHILLRNSLYDTSGKLLATLPFTFEINQAVETDKYYILFSTENIVIINKQGDIIKLIKESESGILGNFDENQIVLEMTQQYLGLLSLQTLELIKIDLGEKLSSTVLLNESLFYVPENNRKRLIKISIKEIFKDQYSKK
jgi:hypothetical protein